MLRAVDAEEFTATVERLLAEHGAAPPSPGCVETVESTACTDCVFCKSCVRCYRSRYSVGCEDGFFLTHCRACTQSNALSYCTECSHCSNSNYLVRCVGCFECDYCFGCVGLVRKEFHILNVKYSRSEYFARTAALRKALGIPDT
jgi:hypothetical protein